MSLPDVGDDLPGELLDRRRIVGDARQVGYEVLDAGIDHRMQALDDLLWRANHELSGVLLVATATPGLPRRLLWIFALVEQVDVDGGGAGDLLVIPTYVLAVASQDV